MSGRRNRSDEEIAMRRLIEPKLREYYPGARIIHELPLRYSSNVIDMAAVTKDLLIAVEIKSSKDVIARLRKQLTQFRYVAHGLIFAPAPKHHVKTTRHIVDYADGTSEELGMLQAPDRGRVVMRRQHVPVRSEAVLIAEEIDGVMVWVTDVSQSLIVTPWTPALSLPWPAKQLDMLHNEELLIVAKQYQAFLGKRPTHDALVRACVRVMPQPQIDAAVCWALRTRNAFDPMSDPPLDEALAVPASPVGAAA